jgi:teichuronic acid biosynthesis glycosyltransferase TuaC
VRALVVTNIAPDPTNPSRGSFVRDQVEGLRGAGVEVELYAFFPTAWRDYLRAAVAIRRLLRRERFDVVHAHYGLSGWCASLAGADPLIVTFHGTDVRHPVVGPLSRRLTRRVELAAGASRALFAAESGRRGLGRRAGRSCVLPCGADLERFRPSPRAEARRTLGLDVEGRYLLFPAAPSRRVKRHDRALELARLVDAELLAGGGIDSGRLPQWFNAANAVVVTSDNEGFGLVAVEALACDVPVLSTPVGIAPTLLRGLDGCLAERFDPDRWATVARRHLDAADPRVSGRRRALWFSAELMAQRALVAYREVLNAQTS